TASPRNGRRGSTAIPDETRAAWGIVRLHGKGNKTRFCPLWRKTMNELHSLIGNRDRDDVSLSQPAMAPPARNPTHLRPVSCIYGLGRTCHGVSPFIRIENATWLMGYEQPHEPTGSEVSNPS